MSRIGRYENPYTSFEFDVALPEGSTCEHFSLPTQDRAACHAMLWLPPGSRPRTAMAFMHPRADFTRHYAVPGLLAAGYAVWTQNSRSVGNDSMLVHEHVLLDVAAGFERLRSLGFENLVAVGNSGGGSLYSFYGAQAAAATGARLTDTAAGAPFDLNRFEMPGFDGIVYLAAHAGEGLFLMDAIDPSVIDEKDPCSCDWKLDMFDHANGFAAPPASTRYDEEFLARYRSGQRARVERIDNKCRERVAKRMEAKEALRADPSDLAALRRATAVEFFAVYRTEADPRYVDLSLDASARDYGSLFGYRPDVINYGPFGFARVVTADAWLSTWSGLSSRGDTAANAAKLDVPALVISYTADNAVFPGGTKDLFGAIGAEDKTVREVAADHYGHPAPGRERGGRAEAVGLIAEWATARGW